MIRLYSGTPGSGKSLHNARDIIMRSRLGEPVIGNFECDLNKYKRANYTYVPNDKLNPDFLIAYSRSWFQGRKIKEGALLLVIDECQLLFNARDWQMSGREKWLSFFTQHRKLGYDVTLIAQFDRMIDRQIRSLIEYEFIHRKFSNFGFYGKILSIVLGGNTFIAVKMWYPLHERIGSEIIHARKSLYGIYDSYATFDTTGAQEGQGAPSAIQPGQSEPAKEEIPKQERKTTQTKIKRYVHLLNFYFVAPVISSLKYIVYVPRHLVYTNSKYQKLKLILHWFLNVFVLFSSFSLLLFIFWFFMFRF